MPKLITFSTGYTTDSDCGFATKVEFHTCLRNTRAGIKGLQVVKTFEEDDMWHVTVETTKKALTELLARIEEDTSSQSVSMEEVKEAVDELWTEA